MQSARAVGVQKIQLARHCGDHAAHHPAPGRKNADRAEQLAGAEDLCLFAHAHGSATNQQNLVCGVNRTKQDGAGLEGAQPHVGAQPIRKLSVRSRIVRVPQWATQLPQARAAGGAMF